MRAERILTAGLLLSVALFAGAAAAQTIDPAPLGSSVERQLSTEQTFSLWAKDPERVKTEAGDHFEQRQKLAESFEIVKLKNVIPPIHFESGAAKIPDSYVATLRKALDAVRERRNVRLHLVGHADSQRLSPALARTFGDNAGLSRERAGEVAEFLKRALQLKPEGVAYEWAGDTQPVASNDTPEGRAQNRRVEVEVWYDQPKAREADDEVVVKQQIKQVKICRVETLCRLRFREGAARRTRLTNLVSPLHYDQENVQVPPEFIEHVRKALSNLGDKSNLVVKFIGYTDDVPLSGRDERIYGDLLSLSKARAHRVALAVKDALKLPGAEIASDGRGAKAPLGQNDSEQGRAQNRRVEVQFWYDDPLQELPDEPQICPNPDSELVTKVYEPAWGNIAPLQLENGQPVIPPGYTDALRRAMSDVHDKANVRLRFVGYTGNERLDRRTAAVYGDDVGLSAARARRAKDEVAQEMSLTPAQAEHEGRGFVQSPDVVNTGFTQGQASYVAVQVVYDEPSMVDDYEGVDITPFTRELTPKNPFGLNTMHITVDGVPFDDPGRSSSDVQRCTDVALDKADIRFQFDDMRSRRRLSVAAAPSVLELHPADGDNLVAAPVRFLMYSNYRAFIARAEVRVFVAGRSPQSTPLAVIAVDRNGTAEWQATAQQLAGAGPQLQYLLRAYGSDGKFDDSKPRFLSLVYEGTRLAVSTPSVAAPGDATPSDPAAGAGPGSDATGSAAPDAAIAAAAAPGAVVEASAVDPGTTAIDASKPADPAEPPALTGPPKEPELLAGYGESALALENIKVSGGTVTVRGGGIPAGHTVWVAGHPVPVDAKGNFVAEEVLPTGAHTVEVAVLDEEGNGTLYLRDLEFKPTDRFYIGMADLTVGKNHADPSQQLMTGANAPFDYNASVSGSLSFFATQKFSNDWRVTASADTREEAVKDLFSNFLNKAPDSLFRRIDPAYYYPTFGDDSVVEELAPTLGKLYVKAERYGDYGLWGNFKLSYMDNELAQVDRGLYGGNLHWGSEATTSFGEKRIVIDGFAAQPGTIASRDEFRGTGGSLYFLHFQDILTGSERIRIEMRDKDSGLVTGTVNLRPSIDYEIDYLQGRIVLAEPLSATASDNLLVRTAGISGQEAYLVVRYEYTPGFQNIRTWSTGGQGDVWINDHVQVGLTASSNDAGVPGSSLRAGNLTLRKSTDSWLKLQTAKSDGLVSGSSYSNDGGFGFASDNPNSFANTSATAYRADASLALGELFSGTKGKLTLYDQHVGAGYSAPGLDALSATQYSGGTLLLPMGDRWNVLAKADHKAQEQGLKTSAEELDLAYKLTKHWTVSTGVRRDDREDNSPVVPVTQQQGQRTDVVAQVGYDSLASWRAYTFAQDTVSHTGDREDNGRAGLGGSYRVSNRLQIDAEGSDGKLGPGGKLGTNYLVSDHTTLYLNYSLQNERSDSGIFERQGSLVSGVKQRFSDSGSVFVEERYQDINSASGLTHAAGVVLTPSDGWNVGVNSEFGRLVDSQTEAQTKRKAAGVRVGYGHENIQLSTGIERRDDEIEAPDATTSELKTWLFRNNFKLQVTPDWRLVGKFDRSISNDTLGSFYAGGFTEATIGYGYRPVANDRLDVLAKYTYFYNMPTAGQMTPQDVAAQFIQKSRIASIDVTYQLDPRVTLGGKYAYRLGQASLDRVNPQFFDNAAQLYIARVDWQLYGEWEGMIEGRALDMRALNEVRSGALVGVYRRLNKHIKAGVGYNFTNFSEDMTDLSFKSHGLFVNVVGAL